MKVNNYIDHTILKADATKDEVRKICSEAKEHEFFSVCVNSWYVPFVKNELKGTNVKITSVVGFPLGAMSTESKVFEAKKAIADGADEIDMVINISALKDKDYDYVLNDIKSIKDAIGKNVLKVIIETCLLTNEEKVKVCELSLEANADFVKTSTGFSTGGATKEDVLLMKNTVGDKALVKASGAVRSYETAIEMINAGASRLGTSSSVAIVTNTVSKSSY